MNLTKTISRMFGYDATESRGRRAPPPRVTMHEDDQANQSKRRILAASARDMARNFSVAAWAIRKHLDYVSSFSFQSKTGDRAFDTELEAYVESVMSRHQFDVARRHPYRRALRLAEACRVKDGDIFWMKLGSGKNRGKIQAIEGDRIRTPSAGDMPGYDMSQWVNGVRVNGSGEAMEYAVCDRISKTQFEVKRRVRSRNMLTVGFYDRYDQVRGVSPIAAGLNWFRDTYEGFEYSLAKTKIGQLFGIAFARDGELSPFGPTTMTEDRDGDDVPESNPETALPQGMFSVDLDPGETANIIESKTPSTETVEFLKLMTHIAIKCLDLPTSFFDESFTNFYGSKGGLVQYQKSCKTKIADLRDFQNEWLRWRLGLAVEDGDLQLPSGMEFQDLHWEFIPDGVPWWDSVKEVRGNSMAVAAGFSNPYRVCNESGTSFEDNVLKTAEAMKFAEENGVDLTFADNQAFVPELATEVNEYEQ